MRIGVTLNEVKLSCVLGNEFFSSSTDFTSLPVWGYSFDLKSAVLTFSVALWPIFRQTIFWIILTLKKPNKPINKTTKQQNNKTARKLDNKITRQQDNKTRRHQNNNTKTIQNIFD